jgi:NAD(P)-dependent dehydrogenase (short-subunit alcohol dehydrogenase family)
MMAGQDLSAHVALVTGASRGIGAAIALTLAESGAAVAVNYRERAADDAEAIVARIKAGGGRAIAVAADVSQAASCRPGRKDHLRARSIDIRQQCRRRDRARRRRSHRTISTAPSRST